MMMEQLLDPDVNVDLYGGGLHLQQNSLAGVLQPGNIDFQGDSVYFGAGSSPLSFAGYLSGGLQDDEVIEYIRCNNGALYDRLWGSGRDGPFEPTTFLITKHQNGSDNAASVSQRNNLATCGDGEMADSTLASDKPRGGPCHASIALPSSPRSVASFDSSSRDIDSLFSYQELTSLAASAPSRSRADLYVLQQMRYIQSLFLNGHILVLQKALPPEATVRSRSCDHPLCRYTLDMLLGSYQSSPKWKKILEKTAETTDKYCMPKGEDGGRYLEVRSTSSRRFYCLRCIEDLFDGVKMLDEDFITSPSNLQASLITHSLAHAPLSVDGSASDTPELHKLVFEAAEKLLTPTRLANKACPGHDTKPASDVMKHRNSDVLTATSVLGSEDSTSTQLSSNSDAVILLRDAKREETNELLQLLRQVASRRQKRRLSQSSKEDEFPTLRILRPVDHPRRQERYKKQGLGERDWRLWRKSLLAPHLQTVNSASINANVKTDNEGQRLCLAQRICSCGELGNSESAVSCSAEFCLIGRFHLKCSGLPRPLVGNETWFCSDCSALFGPGTFNYALVLSPEPSVEHSRVLRSSVRAATGFTKQKEAGNIVAFNESSTDEASVHLSDDEVMDPTYTLPPTPRRQSRSDVGMNFTPCELLDGASDHRSALPRPPISGENTATHAETTGSATGSSPQDETGSARRYMARTQRAFTPTLQGGEGCKMTTKRLKRTSSPPPQLPPSSRHNKTSIGYITAFLDAETRTPAAVLSNAQMVAHEKWKSIHLYSPLVKLIQPWGSEPATPLSSGKTSQQTWPASTFGPNAVGLEFGGTVVDVPWIRGKKLSRIVFEVDKAVER